MKGGEEKSGEKEERPAVSRLLNTYQVPGTVLRVLPELSHLILSTPLRGCDSKRSNDRPVSYEQVYGRARSEIQVSQ